MDGSPAGGNPSSGDWCLFGSQEQRWSSGASRSAASRLHCELLHAGGWRDSAHMLLGDENQDGLGAGGILGGILDVLQPRLKK